MHCRACGYENEITAKYCGQCGADLETKPIGASLVGSSILGRYTIRRVIATGGMGVVYEAHQALGDHSRTVAIKVLLPELSHDHTVLSRFTRECGIVAQLSHQNTVRVYDFGSIEDGTLFIAMEYVRGDSLAEAITAGPLVVGRALSIVEQMCHALHEAHELGIVHRDLKPDNVMLTRLGDQLDFVKILDFGIAVRVSAGGQHETKLTQKGMILGTPPYMSPEQFTGSAVKRQSDIYSLGIILFEILTGRLPFEADSPWAWAQRHLTVTPPDLPSTIPSAIVTTVRAALAKDPALRPATTLEFLDRLYAREQTVSDVPPLASEHPLNQGAGDTQPNRTPFERATARDLPVHREVTLPGDAKTPITQPGAPQSSTYVSAWMPAGTVSPKKAARGRRGLVALLALLVVGLLVFAGWLAYWYELIEIPFAETSEPPPLPVGLSTPSAVPPGGTIAGPIGNWTAPTPPLSQPAPGKANQVPERPRAASSAPPMESATPGVSPNPSAGAGATWPTSWPSIPSSLPPLSLPSSLPPLPSSIMGIPIPSIFQMGPSPAPSGSAPPPAPGLLR